MNAPAPDLSRISKLFADRDRVSPEVALARRAAHSLCLSCGDDVAQSRGLQLAVLTAARIARRCFPGAVRAQLPTDVAAAPLLVWPWLNRRFGDALAEALGVPDPGAGPDRAAATIVFGNAVESESTLRATFDGWIAKVGPVALVQRLREREFCPLAGGLAGSMAVAEVFLSFAGVTIEASRRSVALSLWRPDLDAGHPDALGVPVTHLPAALWVLGLGHLGNAYLWALAALPYPDPKALDWYLADFDRVEGANVETGVLFEEADVDRYKATALGDRLDRMGFRPRKVERWFDEAFRCRTDEPRLALCGFDTNQARRALPTAAFLRVVDSGLGGAASNFDTISLHTWPNARQPEELWPELTAEERERREARQEREAQENPAYAGLGKDECGRAMLAGKSVAVPFVGCVAANLVVAEVLRLLHGGPAYADLRLSLGSPGRLFAPGTRTYMPADTAGMRFVKASAE